MNERETICAMALSRIWRINSAASILAYRTAGSAEAIIDHHQEITKILPEATPRFAEAMRDVSEPLHRAEVELQYCRQHGIKVLCLNDDDYPQRLKECPDAPLVLYYKGNANLNQKRVICIVGTRRCTIYGQDLVRRFLADLHRMCPDTLVISGLAYGIDICAHRHSLENGMQTVGVLAHGLDTLYPPRHRQTAEKMINQGGLLTEFMTQTNADKVNFVRRNRIVAGMSDACIVVESAQHGGALITADIACGYSRDVFAFPGAVNAEYSEGCNLLIRDNKAGLITCAADFVDAMHWETDGTLHEAQQQGIERQLFPELTNDEQRVVAVLQKNNDLQINIITVQAGISIGKLTATLFSLEMKGLIKTLPGGVYHLLK